MGSKEERAHVKVINGGESVHIFRNYSKSIVVRYDVGYGEMDHEFELEVSNQDICTFVKSLFGKVEDETSLLVQTKCIGKNCMYPIKNLEFLINLLRHTKRITVSFKEV